MPLTKFVEQPVIRDAFKQYAARTGLPFDAKAQPLLAPSCGRHHSSVGTAFDYLARFRTARDVVRDMPGADVTVYDTGWAAEDSVRLMERDFRYRQHHKRWSFLVSKARELFDEYVAGGDIPIERVAKCCQFLANVDLLTRIGDFNPHFDKPREEVHAELLALNAAFDPVRLFRPRKTVILNPVFIASHLTDGADGDIMVDRTIVDVKTTNDIGYSSAQLRQLAGYAVLHGMGGVDAGNGTVYAEPVEEVAIYFSRYGLMARWRLDEIFPGDGFDKFAAVCRAEMHAAKPAPSPR